MLFRRRRPPATTPSPAQGVAFAFGQWLGGLGNRMARWSRLTRASIVFAGMAIAIPLFWLGHAGWAVAIGGVALAVFWLSINPTPAEQANQLGVEVLPSTQHEE